jgi:hypothetical protein
MKIYITPPIVNWHILPDSHIGEHYQGNVIQLTGCTGEPLVASFTLQADIDELHGITLAPDIEGMNIRAVKCWYQKVGSNKVLVSELLLNDSDLIRVHDGDNYMRTPDNEEKLMSGTELTVSPYHRWTFDEIPAVDTELLQPVDIPFGKNQQYWINLTVPDVEPGTYTHTIDISDGDGLALGSIKVEVTVLPFPLLEPAQEHGIYYCPKLRKSLPEGSISIYTRNEAQILAEFKDMLAHGITIPTMYQGAEQDPIDFDLMRKWLTQRQAAGYGNNPIFYVGQTSTEPQDPDNVDDIMSVCAEFGITEVYFYAIDECFGHNSGQAGVDKLVAQIPVFEQIHAKGGKVFMAGVKQGHYKDERSPGEFAWVGDYVDVFIAYGEPSKEEAARWHSKGKKMMAYAYPVIGVEEPLTYRINYGLKLWQNDYDGAFPWAYNYHWGNPYNDFDYKNKCQMFGYPTIDGVIGTRQFDGWLAGIIDLRYVRTLEATITAAVAAGIDVTTANEYLASLKVADLTSIDLDSLRQGLKIMIAQLNEAMAEPVEPPEEPTATGKWLFEGSINIEGAISGTITGTVTPIEDNG